MRQLTSYKELQDLYSPLSNRQLLREYRELMQAKADIEPHTKKKGGCGYYLGDNAFLRLEEAKRYLFMCKQELISRGYVIDKIKLKTN